MSEGRWQARKLQGSKQVQNSDQQEAGISERLTTTGGLFVCLYNYYKKWLMVVDLRWDSSSDRL